MFLVSGYIRAAGKGTCYVCRAHRRSADELILDFGREIEFEGALQVCAPCIKEAAGLTGAIEAAVVKAEAKNVFLADALNDSEAKLDAAERAMDAMNLYRAKPRRAKPAADEAE